MKYRHTRLLTFFLFFSSLLFCQTKKKQLENLHLKTDSISTVLDKERKLKQEIENLYQDSKIRINELEETINILKERLSLLKNAFNIVVQKTSQDSTKIAFLMEKEHLHLNKIKELELKIIELNKTISESQKIHYNDVSSDEESVYEEDYISDDMDQIYSEIDVELFSNPSLLNEKKQFHCGFEKVLFDNGNDPHIDGLVSVSDIINVTELFIYLDSETNLMGLGFFKNLKYLKIYYDEDDWEYAPRYDTLYLDDLTNLEYVDLMIDFKNISFKQNLNLKEINLSSVSDIASLNFSNNINIETINVSNLGLSTIYLNNCRKLKSLTCSENNLNSLDLSDCDSIEYLDCSSNNLKDLDLSMNKKLKRLDCEWNPISCEYLRKKYNL